MLEFETFIAVLFTGCVSMVLALQDIFCVYLMHNLSRLYILHVSKMMPSFIPFLSIVDCAVFRFLVFS